MKISDFTVPELRNLVQNCNFTEDETILFNLRSRNIPLEECAEIQNISVSTVKRINKRIRTKIERFLSL